MVAVTAEIDCKNVVAGRDYGGAGGDDVYELITSCKVVMTVPTRWREVGRDLSVASQSGRGAKVKILKIVGNLCLSIEGSYG